MKLLNVIILNIAITLVIACDNSSYANENNSVSIAIGDISQQKLLNEYTSFKKNYQTVNLSNDDIALIKTWPNNIHVVVYFGSWCHDSQREVPRFLKLVEQNTQVSYRLIALDYEKLEPSGSAKNHGIEYTPTFIIYQEKQELGRVIERPEFSFAVDISTILKKSNRLN